MCGPATIAGLSVAMAAASAGAQYVAQVQQAKAQNSMAEQNAENAQASYRVQQAQVVQRLQQQRDQLVQDEQQRDIQAEKAYATARASAATAGVSGLSVNALLSDVVRQRGQGTVTNQQALQTAGMDAMDQEQNLYYQYENRANSVPTTSGPSIISPLLSVGGASVDAYSKYLYPTQNH